MTILNLARTFCNYLKNYKKSKLTIRFLNWNSIKLYQLNKKRRKKLNKKSQSKLNPIFKILEISLNKEINNNKMPGEIGVNNLNKLNHRVNHKINLKIQCFGLNQVMHLIFRINSTKNNPKDLKDLKDLLASLIVNSITKINSTFNSIIQIHNQILRWCPNLSSNHLSNSLNFRLNFSLLQ